jgi:phosphatidylglycerol:prolipoprotein diacylglycerol transferase
MLLLGVVGALILFNVLTKKYKMPNKAYNYYFYTGIIAIVVGMMAAAFFDALYKGLVKELFQAVGTFFTSGVFKTASGVTFYGGLIGGAVTFVVAFLIAKPEVRREFPLLLKLAPPCILVAHALGRVGCFFAGCCYGVEGEGFMFFHFHDGEANFGTNIIEAVFLAVLIIPSLKFIDYSLFIYMFGYGLFRFFIEFARADNRGASIGVLTPSQFISVLLLAGGLIMLALYILYKKQIIHIKLFGKPIKAGAAKVQTESENAAKEDNSDADNK